MINSFQREFGITALRDGNQRKFYTGGLFNNFDGIRPFFELFTIAESLRR